MATALSLIEDALSEIRVKKAGVDLQPDEISDSLRKLNQLMTAWDAQGIHLGYRKVSDSGDETGIPDWAELATGTTLAILLAPSFGKNVSNSLVASQEGAYTAMLNRLIAPPKVHYPGTLPVGSGNQGFESDQRRDFFGDPTFNDLESESDGPLQTEEGFSLDTDIESEQLE